MSLDMRYLERRQQRAISNVEVSYLLSPPCGADLGWMSLKLACPGILGLDSGTGVISHQQEHFNCEVLYRYLLQISFISVRVVQCR
jgi:hypothetical protein